MTLPGFVQRARLRDNGMLQATVLATLHHLGGYETGVTCDELADTVGCGRGRVIACCDELARQEMVVKDRGIVRLTAKASGILQSAKRESEAA